MGEVYRAHDARLNRDVALKVLPDSFARDIDRLARFQREAQTLAALNHPNIAAIYAVEEIAGVRAIAMELVAGETLGERIERAKASRGTVPLAECLAIARQIAAALDVAHERGIVHRDVRPEKIFLIRRSEGCAAPIKLLDFGVAKTPDDRDPSPDWTRNGTPYTSPEQALGKPHDARTDIWSCGVVLYEAITGRRPFSAPNYNALIREIADVTPRPVCEVRRDIPRALGTVIERAMAADPARRFQSAAEFTGDLLALGRELADEAPTTPYGNRDLGALELTMTKLSVRLRPE